MEFDTKLKDWITRYLFETWHRLFQEYLKSYRIAFRVALWLDFEQLSSYLFVYWLLFVFTAEKYHLEFEPKLKYWINRNLIETWQRLFQEYSSHVVSFLGWLYGLFSNNYPVTYSFIGVFLELRYQNITWYLVHNWRIESRDILSKLGTGYFKGVSSHIE